MPYSAEELSSRVDHLEHESEEAEENISSIWKHFHKEKKESDMGMEAMLAALMGSMGNKGVDTAGLMALANQNKGDLPAYLAACQNKGGGAFGGEGGIGIVVLLLFFLMMNNGTFGNRAGVAAAEAACGGADNCQRIIGLHDRISSAQGATEAGFAALNTALCSSIAETIAAVRNQGDRNYDATRNVGDSVRDCCCRLEAGLATVMCEVKGVGRDIRDMGSLLTAKIELEALKATNGQQAMECRLSQKIDDCCCETQKSFLALDNKIDSMNKDNEIARLNRELTTCNQNSLAAVTAQATVSQLERFITTHYVPSPAPATAA